VVKKSFSVAKLGLQEAWKLAIDARTKAVSKIRG